MWPTAFSIFCQVCQPFSYAYYHQLWESHFHDCSG